MAEGQCVSIWQKLGSNLLKLNAEKGHEILPLHLPACRQALAQTKKRNPSLLSLSMECQAPRKTNKLNKAKQNTGTKERKKG